ncbi:hypothetical protein D5282_03240 [bacterium 1xD8-48]|nr:hypothetical protein [Lachnospiraceae bacterium]NBJ96351.1 hypothetical protein [bacterium 1xD8-48]
MTGRFGNGKKALEFLRDNDVDWIDANNVVSDIVKDICEQVVYGTLTPEEAADKFLEDVQSKSDTLKASE